MILLPNNCKCSKPKVSKGVTGWKVWYRFYDENPKPKFVEFRGMNHLEDLSVRTTVCQGLIEDEIDKLKRGFNPRTNTFAVESSINPYTPFVTALELAYDNLTSQHHTKEDIKSNIKFIKVAAKALRYDTMPVDAIRRKHIKELLKKLGAQKDTWTGNTFNSYRKNLSILFEELIENDATELNPVHGIKKKKHAPKKRKILTEEECTLIDKFAYGYDMKFHRLIHIFFHSGARTTEMFKVQGKHVDLKNQSVKYLVLKGRQYEWVERPIKDIVLPFWEEAVIGCGKEDFVFAKGLRPGAAKIDPSQIGRRWKRHIKNKLGIDSDWYALKYLNTSATIDMLDGMKESAKIMAGQTQHKSEAMIVKIYDTKHQERKNDQLKKVNNKFG